MKYLKERLCKLCFKKQPLENAQPLLHTLDFKEQKTVLRMNFDFLGIGIFMCFYLFFSKVALIIRRCAFKILPSATRISK